MKISVLEWQYKNIRRMKELTVKLTGENGEKYSNSLIMMSNGTGKTTTLCLIRAILSGKATEWRERYVRSFRPTDFEASEGHFLLKLAFDQDIYYYILHLDYEEGKAWYETSTAMLEGGYEEGRRLPFPLRGIFTSEEFVSRFVFDGEQARKTLSSGSLEAENALVYLYQLDRLDMLSDTISRMVRNYQEQGMGGTTSRSVKIYKGKADKREQTYRELLSDKKDLEKRLEQMKKDKYDYEKKYQEILAQDNRLKHEQERLLREKEKNEIDITQTISSLMDIIRKPYNLQRAYDEKLKNLVKDMQELKLPKNTAQEFFKELADSEVCVCGRCIGEKERQIILDKAGEYLGEDSLIVVNAIKRSLNEYEREDSCEQQESLLRKLLEKEKETEGGLSRLAIQMAEEGNEEILQIQKEVNLLKSQIEDAEKYLELLTTTDYSTNNGLNADNNIPKAKEARDKAMDSYLKAIGTYEFTLRAEKMKAYIGEVRRNALDRLKYYMVQETNRKIRKLLQNDVVMIKKIDGHLVIEGKEAVSEGQTLAVAYAYIGTLFEHSEFEYPFIVDSPAAPMDLNVRREVARILPQLFHQTVILITSGEKKGFAEMFYKKESTQYLTLKGEKQQTVETFSGQAFFEQYEEKE